MTKRICWKKGMRLTDEIMISSDKCHFESLSQAFVLAAHGRFGLLPSSREFKISISINKNIVNVESLSCLALTKSGRIIDIYYDTTLSNNIDPQATIPSYEDKSFLLCVRANDGWKEVYDGFCEPDYRFEVIREDCALDDDMFPIARIIKNNDWLSDDIDFIPPCLFTTAHPKFGKWIEEFSHILKTSSRKLFESRDTDCQTAISIFLPIVEQIRITIDKESDTMTPMALLGNIQKYISGFLCACTLEKRLNLKEEETFMNYVNIPYDYKDVHKHIKEGLKHCDLVSGKIDKLNDFVQEEVKISAPTISNANLFKKCTNSKVRIPVENNAPGSVIYYTIDGSEPTTSSKSGETITFASGFTGGRDKEEADKYITIKVKSVLNGVSSITNSYTIRLQKDVKHWIEI